VFPPSLRTRRLSSGSEEFPGYSDLTRSKRGVLVGSFTTVFSSFQRNTPPSLRFQEIGALFLMPAAPCPLLPLVPDGSFFYRQASVPSLFFTPFPIVFSSSCSPLRGCVFFLIESMNAVTLPFLIPDENYRDPRTYLYIPSSVSVSPLVSGVKAISDDTFFFSFFRWGTSIDVTSFLSSQTPLTM